MTVREGRKLQSVTVQLEPSTVQLFDELARQERRSRSGYMAYILEGHAELQRSNNEPTNIDAERMFIADDHR